MERILEQQSVDTCSVLTGTFVLPNRVQQSLCRAPIFRQNRRCFFRLPRACHSEICASGLPTVRPSTNLSLSMAAPIGLCSALRFWVDSAASRPRDEVLLLAAPHRYVVYAS